MRQYAQTNNQICGTKMINKKIIEIDQEQSLTCFRFVFEMNRRADRLFKKDDDGLTPMHHAVLTRCPKLLSVLFSNKKYMEWKQINGQDFAGRTPLHIAV